MYDWQFKKTAKRNMWAAAVFMVGMCVYAWAMVLGIKWLIWLSLLCIVAAFIYLLISYR